MNRRDLIRLIALTGIPTLCACASQPFRFFSKQKAQPDERDSGDIGEVKAQPASPKESSKPFEVTEEMLKDVRTRSRYFERDFPDDVHFTGRKFEMMQSLVSKFRAVQRHVGHGNFNMIGMDDFFRFARDATGSNEVTPEEKLFLEEIFYFDAKKYGFQGEKTSGKMFEAIRESEILKIPYTGHFLRKGRPVETYTKIIKEVGDSLILTSGVRGIAKQFHLFFEKGLVTKGNMSKASRSLAPPGYSFHGQGDFDIGRRGFGFKNFTDEFASTEEFKKLIGLGYVQIRYTEDNLLGVRFEPWHIKVHMDS